MAAGEKYQKSGRSNQVSLFGEEEARSLRGAMTPSGITVPACAVEEEIDSISKMEKESLGFYITAHPLARYEARMRECNVIPTEALENQEEGERSVCVCGIVTEEKVVQTKKGDKMAYLRLEDLTGSVEVILFPDLYRVSSPLIKEERPLLITGTLDKTEHGMKFKATTLRLLEGISAPTPLSISDKIESPADIISSLTISLSGDADPSIMNKLKELLSGSPGDIPVYLRVESPDRSVMIDTKKTVTASSLLTAKIEILVGYGKVT